MKSGQPGLLLNLPSGLPTTVGDYDAMVHFGMLIITAYLGRYCSHIRAGDQASWHPKGRSPILYLIGTRIVAAVFRIPHVNDFARERSIRPHATMLSA
jgi:hypothetical protein